MALRTATYISDCRGRSFGASEAEDSGRLPLTRAIPVVAREAGVTQKVARAALLATHDGEWHHTGKYAKRTDYYSIEAAVRSLDPDFARKELIEEFRAKLIAQRDCSRHVSRHSSYRNWIAIIDRMCAARGLGDLCQPNSLYEVARGDFAALGVALDTWEKKLSGERAAKAAAQAERNELEALLADMPVSFDPRSTQHCHHGFGVRVLVHGSRGLCVNIYREQHMKKLTWSIADAIVELKKIREETP